jgi:hypothetical protein
VASEHSEMKIASRLTVSLLPLGWDLNNSMAFRRVDVNCSTSMAFPLAKWVGDAG